MSTLKRVLERVLKKVFYREQVLLKAYILKGILG
jgi:hypothetical protein